MGDVVSGQQHTAGSRSIRELFDLTGRVALITGGTGHLGSAMADALAEAGATVVIASRDEGRAQDAASELKQRHKSVHYGIALDHFGEASISVGFAKAVEQAGQVDIVVNNGHSGHGLDHSNVTAEAFNQDMQNVTGYFLLARELRNHVIQRGGVGSVLMIGSMYGVVGSYPDAYEDICVASPVQYHALKGGIVHMTRHLAVYWAKDGVRVNCLSPGPFPGDQAPAQMVERLKAKSPMGRMGKPDELKGALVLLASDAGSYITGQNLVVDGGWTAW